MQKLQAVALTTANVNDRMLIRFLPNKYLLFSNVSRCSFVLFQGQRQLHTIQLCYLSMHMYVYVHICTVVYGVGDG